MKFEEIDVDELPQMSGSQLCKIWIAVYGKSAPPGLRKELKVPILAARIQEQRFGGLSKTAASRLNRIAKALEQGRAIEEFSRPQIKPGTRLVREWRGQTHVVSAFADHYEYRDESFKSLSEIARRITGTRWSGPLFFGLKKTTEGI
jgi:hypothetical protein